VDTHQTLVALAQVVHQKGEGSTIREDRLELEAELCDTLSAGGDHATISSLPTGGGTAERHH
jgi:hypothetical protein